MAIRRSTRRKRAGEAAFDACDVKRVVITESVYDDTEEGEEAVVSEAPLEDNRYFAGNGAELICPRTEDDGIQISSQYNNHLDRVGAYNSVRTQAGELACGTCMYAGLTPVEVSIARTELANAEVDRIEAYRLRKEAIEELNRQFPVSVEVE